MHAERRYNSLGPFQPAITATIKDITTSLPTLRTMARCVYSVNGCGVKIENAIFGNAYQGQHLHLSILFSVLDIVGDYITEYTLMGDSSIVELYDTSTCYPHVQVLDMDHSQELIERSCEIISSAATDPSNEGWLLPDDFYYNLHNLIVEIAYMLIDLGLKAIVPKFGCEAKVPLGFRFELITPTTIMIGVLFHE